MTDSTVLGGPRWKNYGDHYLRHPRSTTHTIAQTLLLHKTPSATIKLYQVHLAILLYSSNPSSLPQYQPNIAVNPLHYSFYTAESQLNTSFLIHCSLFGIPNPNPLSPSYPCYNLISSIVYFANVVLTTWRIVQRSILLMNKAFNCTILSIGICSTSLPSLLTCLH